ncbi:MAG: dockerin type I domain-containing protein [Ruminococcus sp.]|jgi:photosystem II stability/assembly factor-like uncharacterized protein|nr:dockerin type I domain-containing protein [Ruminococcus sp.]
MKKFLAMLTTLALLITTFAMTVGATNANTDEATPGKGTVTQSTSYEWDNVNIGGGGGFIVGIVYNPTEEGLVYVRTDMGGVYRRDKVTQEWIPITDFAYPNEWNLLGGESVATDPIEPNRVYIAAGTYTNSWTNLNGYILRSDDYGETWQATEMPFKFGGNMPGRGVGERLMIDPHDNSVLYFAARSEKGLWKSTDYGVTWNEIEGLPTLGPIAEEPGGTNEYSNDPIGLCWVTFDETSSAMGEPCNTIYVGAGDPDCPVMVSYDAGNTFEPLEGQPTADTFKKLNPESTLPIGIPHHGVLSKNGYLYITYCDRGGPYQAEDGAVWKYNTENGEWTDITPYLTRSYNSWQENPDGTIGGYVYEYPNYFGFGGIDVYSNGDTDEIMVASLQSWWPDNYIFRSADGGETWNNSGYFSSYPARDLNYTLDISAAPWLTFGGEVNADQGGVVAQGDNPCPKIGWMIESLKINPFNRDEMMYGTGATLYRTDNATVWDTYTYNYDAYPVEVDRSAGFMNIYSAAQGIEECAVLDLITPPGIGADLVSGVGDVGGFIHKDRTQSVLMCTNPVLTSTTGLDYAGLDPKIMVRVGNGDEEQYTPVKHTIATTEDGGETWSEPAQPAYSNIEGWNMPQGGNVAISAAGTSIVWSPDGQTVAMHKDGGWKATNLPIGAVVTSDKVNDNIFYASANGDFYKSVDGGLTFEVMFTIGEGTYKIEAVPGEEGHVWIPVRYENNTDYEIQGLYYTLDGGTSYEKIDGVECATVVGFGKAKEGEDYLAIYSALQINDIYGVYRSDDMGETWIKLTNDYQGYGSINYAITGSLEEYGTVYVATNGRGIQYGILTDENEQYIQIEDVMTKLKYLTNGETPVKPEPDFILGDITNDKSVNIIDVAAMKEYLIKGGVLSEIAVKNADMNKDDTIGIADLIALKKFILGI